MYKFKIISSDFLLDIWFHLYMRKKQGVQRFKRCVFSPSFYQFLRVEYNLPAPGVMIDELHNHTTMWCVATYHVNENTSIIRNVYELSTDWFQLVAPREKLTEHCRRDTTDTAMPSFPLSRRQRRRPQRLPTIKISLLVHLQFFFHSFTRLCYTTCLRVPYIYDASNVFFFFRKYCS